LIFENKLGSIERFMNPVMSPKKKIALPDVSLVCIETRVPQLAIFALRKCMEALLFKENLLLGARPDFVPENIQHVDIGKITSKQDYSSFVVRRLGNYIRGDYVLIVQADGFVIHPECWTPDFLGVDYIGAPWSKHPEKVGNGGFSLRSRRLLDALKNLNAEYIHPEDDYICRLHRSELERRYGIVFAPVALAEKFSFEEIDPKKPTFGFHRIYNIPKVLSDDDLHVYTGLMQGDFLYSEMGRKIIKGLYKNGYYSEARRLIRRRMKGPDMIHRDAILLWGRCLFHQLMWRKPCMKNQ
jgi:hypothetical protein